MEIFSVLIVLVMFGFFAWEMILSPMARSTRELHKLNEIWRRFNEHTHSNDEIEQMLSAQ